MFVVYACCSCVSVCGVCVCIHRCLEVRGHCEVTSSITYILRQAPLPGSGAHQLPRLAGQWGPRTPQFPLQQYRDYGHVLPSSFSDVCCRSELGSSCLLANTLLTEPSPFWSPILCMHHVLFIPSVDDGYEDRLCLLSIRDNMVMDIHLWVFM